MFRTSSRVRGFTLIEVLVVVAMIALLISILLPSLRAAREQSKAMMCGTHLNQTFSATFMYTQQHKDRLPHFGFRTDTKLMDWWWPTQLAKYIVNQFDLYTCPTDKTRSLVFVDFSKPKFLRMWVGNAGQTKIPVELSFRGSCDLLNDANVWRVPGKDLSPMPRRINDFKRPATSLMLVEGSIEANSTTEQCYRYSDLLTFVNSKTLSVRSSWRRHNGRANYLFLDGHVGRHTPEQATRQIMYQQEFYDVSPPSK